MDEDSFTTRLELAQARVAIVGLGLMGGSLALALRNRCLEVLGVDRNPLTVSEAVDREVVARASQDVKEILPAASVIILATPVHVIQEYLRKLPDLHPGPALVLDLGSTKVEVTQAMQDLPARFDPVGGHPMCGKEVGGLENAEASIFLGAPFAFTPLTRTSQIGRVFCNELAQAVGAHPLWMDAETHDRWTAATSHFPYLVSNVLAGITPLEAGPMVGPGFRSTTRLGASPPEVMRDILETNSDNILIGMAQFKERLELAENLLVQRDFDALERLLIDGAKQRKSLTSN
jgi:prephenate dehydrogenase